MAPPRGSYQSIEMITNRRKRIIWMSERYGMRVPEIARELGLSPRTVQRHRSAHRRGIAPKHPGMQKGKKHAGSAVEGSA